MEVTLRRLDSAQCCLSRRSGGKEAPCNRLQGPAELIDHEGNVIDLVTASLSGGEGSWGGHVQGPLLDGPNWTEVIRIRLETGTEAEITLEEEASWTIDLQPVHEAHSGPRQ
jgi:hypothetical protein